MVIKDGFAIRCGDNKQNFELYAINVLDLSPLLASTGLSRIRC